MLFSDLFEGSNATTLQNLMLEGAADRYRQMFQGILQTNPKLKKNVDAEISWAQKTLKKDDKIIWYLRFSQIYMMMSNLPQTPEATQAFEKKLGNVARKAGVTPEKIKVSAEQVANPQFKTNIKHYLSLPIQDINTFKFAWQSPQEVINAFQESESEWKENQSRVIPANEDHEVVIDFKDGFRWYNLNKAYCSDEARAMGHCGNSPRSGSDDSILSLRKDVNMGENGIQHSPVLTFILRSDGYLSEMKGRGNDKPAEKYHKYIVPLLKLDMIEGIKGGGYMAGNNFSLEDLDEYEKDELLEQKPELAGPVAQIRKLIEEEKYDEILDALVDKLSDEGMEYDVIQYIEKPTKKNAHYVGIRISLYEDFEQLSNIVEDAPVKSLYSIRDEVKENLTNHKEWFEKNKNWYKDWLHKHGYSKLSNKKQYQLFKDNPDLPSKEEVKKKVAQDIGPDSGESVKRIEERIRQYAKLGYSVDGVYSLALWEVDDKKPLGEWQLGINLGDLLDLLEGDTDEDSDNYYAIYSWKENVSPSHYIKLDEYNDERRKEEDLNVTFEADDIAQDIEAEFPEDE